MVLNFRVEIKGPGEDSLLHNSNSKLTVLAHACSPCSQEDEAKREGHMKMGTGDQPGPQN